MAHYPPLAVEHIDLSDTEFWGWPMADRQAAFAMLRSLDHPPLYEEPEFIFETGPGYYALVRHADVVEGPAWNPEVFSGQGRHLDRGSPGRVQRVLRVDDQHG